MREIIYTEEFDECVDRLGGYRIVDVALDSIIESLYRNPLAFPRISNPYASFRFATTRAVFDLPPLVVVFELSDNGDVVLRHIEEHLSY